MKEKLADTITAAGLAGADAAPFLHDVERIPLSQLQGDELESATLHDVAVCGDRGSRLRGELRRVRAADHFPELSRLRTPAPLDFSQMAA